MVQLRLNVDPPVFHPAGYGLLSVAEPAADTADPHWRNGVQYQPVYCGPALNTTAFCVSGGPTKAALPAGWPVKAADPFTVYGWLDCSPVGYSPEAWKQTTIQALVNNEAAAVEAAFWTGAITGQTLYPHLAANTAVFEGTPGVSQQVTVQTAAGVVITGGGVDIVEAVGLLEGAMGGCYGGTPVLHVPRRALANMAAWSLVVKDGPRLRTPAGSLIAAGLGYPGTGPDGTLPANALWCYATGAVKVWRSAIELTGRNPAEWVGRAHNDQTLVAERTYVIGWDCCHFAVPVVFGGDVTGSTGTYT